MKEKIVSIEKVERGGVKPEYIATTLDGKEDCTVEISLTIRKRAYEAGNYIKLNPDTNKWNRIEKSEVEGMNFAKTEDEKQPEPKIVNLNPEQMEMIKFVHNSFKLKPAVLQMNELKWKFLVRSAMRGKNIMMTGPAGSGKTMSAKALVAALNRPDFYFNLGATQDPRTTLIGNTQFAKDKGTYFSESLFVKAIQTENAVILLDELSRAHPEAWNILMTVLDQTQRYLRLDEQKGTPTIKVADGVTFITTTNTNNEYTATRVMDRALLDRFTIIEVDVLEKEAELKLLRMLFPAVAEKKLEAIAEITDLTRKEVKNQTPKIQTSISTRVAVEMASLLYDGFSLKDASTVAIIPFFSAEGGADSERTFITQLVQKYCDDDSSDNLFNLEDVSK